jgi:hypothetical protein
MKLSNQKQALIFNFFNQKQIASVSGLLLGLFELKKEDIFKITYK